MDNGKINRRNFTHPQQPRYAGPDRVPAPKTLPRSLRIVSMNIRFSRRIIQALKLFSTAEELTNADIVCLQEMDSAGIHRLAEALGFNYVYYPAVIHPYHEREFGNAILSRWPILEDKKIILPHLDNKNLQRIAVQAVLQIHSRTVVVFSVHMKVILKPIKRGDQMDFLIRSIPPNISHCIVAGDFNTFSRLSHEAVGRPFHASGFTQASQAPLWTYQHWYLLNRKSLLDHIFVRGFDVVSCATVPSKAASDHFPLWAEIKLK